MILPHSHRDLGSGRVVAPSSGSLLSLLNIIMLVSEEKKPSSLELFTDLQAGVKLPDELERAILDVMGVAPSSEHNSSVDGCDRAGQLSCSSLSRSCLVSLFCTKPVSLASPAALQASDSKQSLLW